MTFLSLHNVTHTFFHDNGYSKALDKVTLDVKQGEFVSILGPSGSGKSTLLSILCSLLQQTSGTITLNDQPLQSSTKSIGYMFQSDYLFPWKTILTNVLIGPKLNKTYDESMETKALQLLDDVGLINVTKKYPAELSGGMRQRAALVRTLINDPEMILLDEPFSALDYYTKLKLEDLVASLLTKYKKTTILVTHDIGEAISMSDRIILLSKSPGTIVKQFHVPVELRDIRPFLCRRHPKYQKLFDHIWQTMNILENGKKEEVRGEKQ